MTYSWIWSFFLPVATSCCRCRAATAVQPLPLPFTATATDTATTSTATAMLPLSVSLLNIRGFFFEKRSRNFDFFPKKKYSFFLYFLMLGKKDPFLSNTLPLPFYATALLPLPFCCATTAIRPLLLPVTATAAAATTTATLPLPDGRKALPMDQIT